MSKDKSFTVGSGDVFKDFGFSDEDASVLAIKSSLFRTLQEAMREVAKDNTQAVLAKMLRIPQPKVSDILNGKMSGFSMERIANYLTRLNYQIVIDARPGKVTGRAKRKSPVAAATATVSRTKTMRAR